ncbi:capsule biosynthesis protein [Oryzifoliimicrobium ureilyticus]|uniref:capsule biosynthesis protein n=1 Tax=Oryzifoliimicrobium ureilyticus TaxID=3113724 RepID=UPI0030766758
MSEQTGSDRVFLFLQGPSSILFSRIGDQLAAAGAKVLRINLNAGDQVFWRRPGAIAYRGTSSAWPDFVMRLMRDEGVTDLVLLGEERPYHKAAVNAARGLGIGVYVIEMGHLRPDWITVERDGLSSNSRFPDDPGAILSAAANLPEPDFTRHFSHSFFQEAKADLLYYLPTVFLSFLYPHYRVHGLYNPLREYAGWIPQLVFAGRRRQRAEAIAASILSAQSPFFLYPLQLQTDFQLRAHSPFHCQEDAIRFVLASFSRYAAREARLVIKLHPLDAGIVDWRAYISGLASGNNLAGRVDVLDGGDLNALVARSQGMVTVNSTAALNALQAGKPVKVLGESIYRIKGLTDEKSLDEFWSNPANPSMELLSAFIRLIAAAVQVRGDFYARDGAEAAATAISARLLARNVNQPGAYVTPPPRRHPDKIVVP